jgi:hypothetical protein
MPEVFQNLPAGQVRVERGFAGHISKGRDGSNVLLTASAVISAISSSEYLKSSEYIRLLANIYIIAHNSTSAEEFKQRERLGDLLGEGLAGIFFSASIHQADRYHAKVLHLIGVCEVQLTFMLQFVPTWKGEVIPSSMPVKMGAVVPFPMGVDGFEVTESTTLGVGVGVLVGVTEFPEGVAVPMFGDDNLINPNIPVIMAANIRAPAPIHAATTCGSIGFFALNGLLLIFVCSNVVP